jgi:hypothetical protein
MPNSKILNVKPFPPLTLKSLGDWDNGSWEGEVTMSFWQQFQNRSGPYCSQETDDAESFTISIEAAGKQVPPTLEQAAAFEFLMLNHLRVHEVVMDAAFTSYPNNRQDYRDGYGLTGATGKLLEVLERDYGSTVPELASAAELDKVMGLNQIHILSYAKDGVAYIGFEFGCNWDEEHGFGILMHKERIVEIGSAHLSFESVDEEGCVDLDEERRNAPEPLLN